jgi:hypothetical protein
MSEVLARLRVRETHGIRRFLYPLTVIMPLPEGAGMFTTGLQTSDGQEVPLLISSASGTEEPPHRLDFAVSLEPLSTLELLLVNDSSPMLVADPIQFNTVQESNCQRSKQQRFQLDIDWDNNIESVVYDQISHMQRESSVTRNAEAMNRHDYRNLFGDDLISAWAVAYGKYNDNCHAWSRVELTACKSWATITHCLEHPKPNDEIIFTLPLAITAPTLTCDFGVGGYVFGKLDDKAPEIVWRTEFGDAPHARWSVATAGRTDYVGEVATAEEFLPQRWLHLVDSDKALAVAITQVPPDCRDMAVRLTHEGDVSIAFRLGETITGVAEFSVCYHFLNDVPAIAAATNPQSILLPPVVEVLPV